MHTTHYLCSRQNLPHPNPRLSRVPRLVLSIAITIEIYLFGTMLILTFTPLIISVAIRISLVPTLIPALISAKFAG